MFLISLFNGVLERQEPIIEIVKMACIRADGLAAAPLLY